MKYDRVSFSAKPGEITKIVFTNSDDLPQNLIVCKPAYLFLDLINGPNPLDA